MRGQVMRGRVRRNGVSAARLVASLAWIGLAPGIAAADGLGLGLGLPGFGGGAVERPGYAESYDAYPPEQHNILGMPEAPPSPYDRPSYREAYDDYPPAAGRYGGGFIEYMMTGGRLAPEAAPAPASPIYAAPAYAAPLYPPAAPVYAATAPSAAARGLPRARLPEYAPDQPPAYFGGPQSMATPLAPSPPRADG